MKPGNSKPSLAILSFPFLLCALPVSEAHGQITVDLSKLNCEQLYFSKLDSRTISAWLNGFYHGKKNDPVVDVQKVKDNTEKLRRFCFQNANMKVPVMDAVERVLAPQR